MKRYISQQLQQWKLEKYRKPLIIKGVRQTGKTFILKEFGATHFPIYHYINFEQDQKIAHIFMPDLNPKRIITELSFLLNRSINCDTDLIIFDEVQVCPQALTSLKYFAEQMPQLALCCAGSLLGLHLGESSFPVGKVSFLNMKPMCFAEFLEANQDDRSLDILNNASSDSSIPHIVHEHLWEQFKIYLVVGGLPEVVVTYLEHKDNLYYGLMQARQKQEALIYGYYADIAKHAGKVNSMHIDRVWRSIPMQLAQSQDGSSKRFQFKGIVPGIDRYQRLANVLDWLIATELIIKIPIIEHVELPLAAYIQESHFKLYLFDVGILGALSDLSPQSILGYRYGTYKGYFAENFIAQEFLVKNATHLYCWQKERMEVEFLYPLDTHIIPLEVKSGWITKAQSLAQYVKKYNPIYRVIFSAKPFHIDLTHRCYQYPLYMAYWFPAPLTEK